MGLKVEMIYWWVNQKFKCCFYASGYWQLEGIDFFETYKPVVQWNSVCLLLILEVMMDLKSNQGDITTDFFLEDL